MRSPIDHSHRKILALFSRTKKPPQAKTGKTDWCIIVCTLLALALIGFYTGHFSGASAVPMAATVVPLLFGLLTVVLIHDVTWNKLIAVFIFTAAFSQGHKLGQHVDESHNVEQMLNHREQRVSNDVYEQLTLLDLQLSAQKLDGTRHNSILYGVGASIIENAALSESDKLAALKRYRSELNAIAK
jgi:hypothetical protein